MQHENNDPFQPLTAQQIHSGRYFRINTENGYFYCEITGIADQAQAFLNALN